MANNAIQNLIGNRDAIRKIMARDANGQMDTIAENARKSGALSFDESGVVYNGGSSQSQQQENNGAVVVNESVMRQHIGMPRQILESFQKNPGKTPSNSVLGNIPDEQLAKISQPKQQIRESVQQPVSQQSAAIDYSLLKTIINEAVQENVKKYMSALSKKLITEGVGSKESNSLMCMKLGNTFSFIDSEGNIYEAELKFKKQIKG